MKKTLSAILATILLICTFNVSAFAAETPIKASNAASFESALDKVADMGTVTLSGTIAVASSFKWKEHGKRITVTGGTLDLSAVSDMTFGDDVFFDNITLILKNGSDVYANGHDLTIASGAAVINTVNLYGGSKGGVLNRDTNLHIESGNYHRIFGASNGGTLNGNTNVYVGGNVNSACQWTDHAETYAMYGGGNGTVINGSTSITVGGNAKANYIYGGSVGAGSSIRDGSALTVKENAKAMSLYGASNGVNTGNDATLIMLGGETQQVFGGSQKASLSRNSREVSVNVKLLGGKVTRRVYGGCYNEASRSGFSIVWSDGCSVAGTVSLTIGENIIFEFDETFDDRGIIVHSRRKNISDSEKAILIYASSKAYTTHNKRFGIQDTIGALMYTLSGSSAPKSTNAAYTVDYTVEGSTIRETRSSGTSATATLSLTQNNPVYTGNALECAEVTYSDSWISGPIDSLVYKNNVNSGIATAAASINGYDFSLDFMIEKAERSAPALTVTDESIFGKSDGKINGLGTDMEYSTDGINYIKVTSTKMTFCAGTYHVRYAETDNFKVSEPSELIIGRGRMLKITFKADGFKDIVREVAYGAALTDIPEIPAKEGYTDTPPVWSVNDFSSITKDRTVTAIYTKDVEPLPPTTEPDEETPGGSEDLPEGDLPGGGEDLPEGEIPGGGEDLPEGEISGGSEDLPEGEVPGGGEDLPEGEIPGGGEDLPEGELPGGGEDLPEGEIPGGSEDLPEGEVPGGGEDLPEGELPGGGDPTDTPKDPEDSDPNGKDQGADDNKSNGKDPQNDRRTKNISGTVIVSLSALFCIILVSTLTVIIVKKKK